MDFIKEVLAGPSAWSGEHWAFVVSLIALVGVNWVFHIPAKLYRWLKPKTVAPVPFYQVPDPSTPPPPPPQKKRTDINLPQIQREVFGREVELQQLYDGLQAQGHAAVTAVVQGHGGYGKSTLARHYIARHGDRYEGILWTVAEDATELANGLLPAAKALGLDIATLPPKVAAAQVLAAMAEQGHWLVVYDNVHRYADIKDLMPQSGTHLIVTTRESEGWGIWPKVRPEVLPWDGPESPAVRLLLEEARSDDAKGAEALAQALGGLPLALIVAGAEARHDGFAAVRSRIGELLATAPRNGDYPDSVIGAVALSYERLPEDARRLLDVLAWWGAEGLGPELFTGGAEGRHMGLDTDWIDPEEAALADDPARLRRAFSDLSAASLLTRDGDGFAMHRMSAAALRAMQAERGEDAPLRAAVELLATVFPAEGVLESKNWPLCARLLPHVTALWDSVEPRTKPGPAPSGAALDYLLNQAGIYLSGNGDHAGELRLMKASLTLRRARLPEEHRDIAAALANLGAALMRQDDFDAAEQHLSKAVALTRAHRPDSLDLADSLDLLGVVRERRHRAGQGGDPAEAIAWHEEALALYRTHLGPRHAKVAKVLNNLAVLRNALGETAAAADLAAQALDIRRAVLPAGDNRLSFSLLTVGALHLEAGQARQAEPLLREAYDLRSALHKPDHEGLRNAAGWLISCHLVLARQPGAQGPHEMKATQLCKAHGFDLVQRKATALQYPDPVPA